MSESFDVIIVGAGIIGTSCAMECASAGLKTLVLERNAVAAATTSAGMGHIVVMDDSTALLDLTCYSRRLWQELAPAFPSAVGYNQCGTLWIAENSEQMAEVYRKHKALTGHGVAAEILDSSRVAELEPSLRSGLAGGLLVPDDAVTDAPAAAKFCLQRALAKGAELRVPAMVTGLLPEGGVILDDGESIRARNVVNAAGPWSPELSVGLPVRKRKGHLIITREFPHFVRHQVVELGYAAGAQSDADTVACNLQPRMDGGVNIGASRQYGAETTDIEPEIMERMLKRAVQFFPALANLRERPARAGFRAATPDKLPLIGKLARHEHLWIATGHEGLGITTAPATGKMLAQMILGKQNDIPAGPYDPNRFTATSINTN